MSHLTPAPRLTAWTLINVILRNRRLIVGCIFVMATIGLIRAIARPQTFTSSVSFAPSGRNQAGSLSGLAAQLGVDMDAQTSAQSPAFYVDLIKSRPLLQEVVKAHYSIPGDVSAPHATLEEIYNITAPSPALRLERAVLQLRSATTVNLSKATGVVSFTVEAASPDLAQEIAQQLLNAIMRFDVSTRTSQAREERRFAEQRLAQIEAQVRSAESALLAFEQANRSIANDPSLRMQQDRRERELSRVQQVYATMSQTYETAKVNEVRDTPTITLIELPQQSTLPAPRRRVLSVLLGIIYGAALGLLLAFIRELLVPRDQMTLDEALESRKLFASARADVKALIGRARRTTIAVR